jgi:hypothetical protein
MSKQQLHQRGRKDIQRIKRVYIHRVFIEIALEKSEQFEDRLGIGEYYKIGPSG